MLQNFCDGPYLRKISQRMEEAMRLAAITAALIACCLTGCGTIQNFTPEAQNTLASTNYLAQEPRMHQYDVYGGVQNDAERWKWLFSGPQGMAWPVLCPFLAADFAFSFIGDTLTLPVTISVNLYRSTSNDSTSNSQASGQPGSP